VSLEKLPYYMDGDVKLSQTFAILKYLGRKHNMKANNQKEQIRLDLIEAEAEDMRSKWSTLVYSPEFVCSIHFTPLKYVYVILHSTSYCFLCILGAEKDWFRQEPHGQVEGTVRFFGNSWLLCRWSRMYNYLLNFIWLDFADNSLFFKNK